MKRNWKTPGIAIILLVIGGLSGIFGLIFGKMIHPALFFIFVPVGIILIGTGMYGTIDLLNRMSHHSEAKIEYPHFIEREEKSVPERFHQVKDGNMLEILLRTNRKVRELEIISQEADNNRMREKLSMIIGDCDQILDEIIEMPHLLPKIRPFLNTLLDITVELLHKYGDLQAKIQHTPDIDQSLKKTEALMDTLHSAFRKQLETLYSDEALQLDLEVDVVKKALIEYGK